MCWNATVSIQSFIIGSIAIILGVLYGSVDIVSAIFYGSIVFMQLIEYIIWTYGTNQTINYYASVSASLLLLIQPLALLYTIPQIKIRNKLIALYIVIGAIYKYFIKHTDYHISKSNGHLEWNWLRLNKITFIGLCIYFIFLFLPIIITKNWTILFVALLTLFTSLYYYHKYNTWGSMWCWIVNIIVVIVCYKSILDLKR